MRIYSVYFNDGSGNTDLVATTNNLDKWLEENNEQRIADGLDPERLDDFEIEEADTYIYEEKPNEI